jgi:sensor histidine kinase YesM
MRHVLRGTERESIPLSEEVAFMQHYVELMKMRLPAQVQVECAFPAAGTDLPVPPLLFIPFIENAFKHGVGVDKGCLIRVALKRSGTRLHLHVSNPNASGRTDAPPPAFGPRAARRAH